MWRYSKAWREVGGIETIKGLFDFDEGDFKDLPPSPPAMPQDFEQVLADMADWEARRGSGDISKSLGSISGLVKGLNQIYAGMAVYAENTQYGPIPERAQAAYNLQMSQLEATLQSLFKGIDRHRQGAGTRLLKAGRSWWRKAR